MALHQGGHDLPPGSVALAMEWLRALP